MPSSLLGLKRTIYKSLDYVWKYQKLFRGIINDNYLVR